MRWSGARPAKARVLPEYHIRFIWPEGALNQSQVTTAANDEDAAACARARMVQEAFSGCAEIWCGFRRVALVSSAG